MSKQQFLKALEFELKGLPASDRAEILSDYSEHFEIGRGKGRSEEEVAKALGSPSGIAKQYRAFQVIERAESSATATNIFRAVVAVVGLGFFNLFFILAPFLFAVSLIFACFVFSVSLVLGGPLMLFGSLYPDFISVPLVLLSNRLALGSVSVGLVSLGLLCGIGSFYVARWFFRGTLWYLKTNVRLITGGGR